MQHSFADIAELLYQSLQITERLEHEFGKNYKVKFKGITEKKKLNRDNIDSLENRLDYNYEISKGYEVCFQVNIKGHKGEQTAGNVLIIVMIDGKWNLTDLEGLCITDISTYLIIKE